MWISQVKKFLLELLFPSFCLGCQEKEETYLCEDCESTLEISSFHQPYQGLNFSDLYFAINYQNPLIKILIRKFKYQPFIKELAKPLTYLIIKHFQLLEKNLNFFKAILIPVPLTKKKQKERGFNQAEEIAKELSLFLRVPLISNLLIKIKETPSQTEVSAEKRRENLKNAFLCQDFNKIKNKTILLIDDVFTTGSTLEECSRVLKKAGAKKIIGIVIAKE